MKHLQTDTLDFYAPCAKGLEYLLRDELLALGAESAKEALAGVHFQSSFDFAVAACVQLRLASRVLLVLDRFALPDADALYQSTLDLPWEKWLKPRRSIAIDVSGSAPCFNNTQFAAFKTKDAIVDRMQQQGLPRPDVDLRQPDVRLRLYLHPKDAALMWDLAGAALHERTLRVTQGDAPIKETLAAAMLMRSNWSELAKQGACLIDPMCGAGTILGEALLMAADIAPGLRRAERCEYGFFEHPWFNRERYDQLVLELQQRASAGLKALGTEQRFFGFDVDPSMMGRSKKNLQHADLAGFVKLQQHEVSKVQRPAALAPVADTTSKGLVICNPPYGERMGNAKDLVADYRALGQMLHREFPDFSATVISSDSFLLESIELPAIKRYQVKNGALDCTIVLLDAAREPRAKGSVKPDDEQLLMLKNRLEKNTRRLKSYLSQIDTEAYRIYDADLPEYAAAIDRYGDQLHIQEYQAPKEVPEALANKRLQTLVQAAQQYFGVSKEKTSVKQRKRDRGGSQYGRSHRFGDARNDADNFFQIAECGHGFWVNLQDYLDTGLFLDSRMLRQRVQKSSAGKRFLNLYCYTGSATVYAAAGGAAHSVSVDLSPTYLAWAGRNFRLNRMDPDQHELVQGDVLSYLQQERDTYDLIYLDPPTFSNSKRTETVLDLQDDHPELIELCMQRLRREGELLFVCNAKKLKLDPTIQEKYTVRDLSAKSIPPDFERHADIHRAWSIQHKQP